MKTRNSYLLGLLYLLLLFLFIKPIPIVQAPIEDFEIILPWDLTHERGKIIKSMIDNHTTLATKYNYIYTQVGGNPGDRDALVARFMAGDYPNLIITTQDWYAEFATFGIWHNFSSDIAAWTGGRAGWRADIPDGWWSILDKKLGDGTGSEIYALPFFGQTILPYINLDDFADTGLTESDVDTLEGFLKAAEKLKTAGKTPYAMVGKLQSDLAYMNYMFASTDHFINSSNDPATVYPWDAAGNYGVNGILSVEGFAAYLKLKGEGWVQETVDTDGGGECNTLFGAGDASMILTGPWGTQIFMGAGLTGSQFKAIPMPKSSNGLRSTITGGGISWVPKEPFQSAALETDAVTLAEWLLEDENQVKTVDNWLETSWRIPVRESLKTNAWFTNTSHPERANYVTHIESQAYAYPWGKQHPDWITVHLNIMIPEYRNELLKISHGAQYSDDEYITRAQSALDNMAQEIQCDYLGGPCIPNKRPSAHILTPNGGEIYDKVDKDVVISWDMLDPDGDPLKASFYYSLDDGSSWNKIISDISTGPYNWDISNLPESSNYLIRIIVSDGQLIALDSSNGTFEIMKTQESTTTTTTTTLTTSEKTTSITNFSPLGIIIAVIVIVSLLRRKKFNE